MLAVISVQAQVSQAVIASSGGYNINGNMTISWTLGETVISTLQSKDKTIMLTHGFQQDLLVTAVEETIVEPAKIKVFPNPVGDAVYIEIEAPLDEEVGLEVFDSQGKIFRTDRIEPASRVKQINFQDVPGGIYYLRLSNGKHTNVYKVVKL
jgi:hypothetical protein